MSNNFVRLTRWQVHWFEPTQPTCPFSIFDSGFRIWNAELAAQWNRTGGSGADRGRSYLDELKLSLRPKETLRSALARCPAPSGYARSDRDQKLEMIARRRRTGKRTDNRPRRELCRSRDNRIQHPHMEKP